MRAHLRTWLTLGLLAVSGGGALVAQQGQQAQPPPPPPAINQSDDPRLRAFRWRSIGPANMGGRIDDIAVVESNPSIYYIGFATGGVWKTVNNGTTFTPIFDTYPTSSIGDIAVHQANPDIVWVGTGEPNNRQSSSFGDGVYKSTDAGKTFVNVGLSETQSIGRIVLDPKDTTVAYVAAVGHLFGPNPERGLYKTTDGGKTWRNLKPIDHDTGFIDVAMHPTDPRVLFAASYQRRRVPWGFNGGGPGSGLWKTTDAGRTWTRIAGGGFPEGLLGRIGVEVSRSKPNVVYAQVEVGPSAGAGAGVTADGKPQEPGAGGFGGGGGQAQPRQDEPPDPKRSGVWRSDDGGKTWRIMSNNNNRPMYYSQIRIDPTTDQIVYTMGAPFYKSTDGGKTFRTVAGIAHGDHHALWINPRDNQHLVLGNDGGLDVSYDQGETWDFINTMAVSQFYAISVDMRRPYYVCGGLQDNGSWCGPSATRSTTGILNSDWYRIGGGDGFYTQSDPTDHTVVYAESQDGNTNRVDLRLGRTQSIRPRGPQRRRPQPAQALAQFAAQFGFGQPPRVNIVPPPPEGEQPRFYWNTPFIISPHNPRTLYLGGEKLFRSMDRGETWTASADLTRNISRFTHPIMGVGGMEPMASKHDGAASYSNITTIGESFVQPGVLWVGTNDGNVQLSRDGGATWKNVAGTVQGLPDGTHVSRVEPSHHEAGTCYVTFDGHRTNDHAPYVYVTRDFGTTWTSIVSNLPRGNVNVIREDPTNPRLLYLGTEYAFYVTLDGGGEWKRFMTGLPTVRVDDIAVHPRDNDLVIGTHGRGVWIVDDITPLQAMTDGVEKADVHLFEPRPAVQWITDIQKQITVGGAKHFRGQNPAAGTAISYYLRTPPTDEITITVADITGKVVRNMTGTKEAGLNRVQWNLRGDPPPRPANLPQGAGGGPGGQPPLGPLMEPGMYLVKVTIGGKELATRIAIERDELPIR
jgi:photosystem II stability/assembly factor-like uncharacterized protein